MERDGLIIRMDLICRLRHVEYSLSDSGDFALLRLINTFDRMGRAMCIIASEAPMLLAAYPDNRFEVAWHKKSGARYAI